MSKGEKIGDLTLIKKLEGTKGFEIYETWLIEKFDGKVQKPYVAHLFKYNLNGQFPVKKKHLDTFCINILDHNKKLLDRNLSTRSMRCHNNRSQEWMTPSNAIFSYILFDLPDGGYRLDDVCDESCTKDRVCRYSLKNFARGLLRMTKMTLDTPKNTLYDLNFLMFKDAFYFGKMAKCNPVVDDKKSNPENFSPYSSIAIGIKSLKVYTEDDINHYFQVVPVFKFFTAENIKNIDKINKEDNKALEKIRMYEIGKFIENMYTGLVESKQFNIFIQGDNFKAEDTPKMGQLFYRMNKNDIEENNIHADRYFSINVKFAKQLQEFLGAQDKKDLSNLTKVPELIKELEKKLEDVENFLNKSFFEFVQKLIAYNDDQFDKIEHSLNHEFLKGAFPITKILSDTGEY